MRLIWPLPSPCKQIRGAGPKSGGGLTKRSMRRCSSPQITARRPIREHLPSLVLLPARTNLGTTWLAQVELLYQVIIHTEGEKLFIPRQDDHCPLTNPNTLTGQKISALCGSIFLYSLTWKCTRCLNRLWMSRCLDILSDKSS